MIVATFGAHSSDCIYTTLKITQISSFVSFGVICLSALHQANLKKVPVSEGVGPFIYPRKKEKRKNETRIRCNMWDGLDISEADRVRMNLCSAIAIQTILWPG